MLPEGRHILNSFVSIHYSRNLPNFMAAMEVENLLGIGCVKTKPVRNRQIFQIRREASKYISKQSYTTSLIILALLLTFSGISRVVVVHWNVKIKVL